jgi:CarD family transcriptional regulator
MAKKKFRIGDKVVYPHHGAAIIEGMQRREVEGENRNYWVIRLSYGDLTLMVPTDGTEVVGLRGVVSKKELEQVFTVLKSKKQAPAPSNWSRRFKGHVEKLRSGDIFQVAEVVRNLSNRDKDKGLSAGEKRMLTKARQILVSEVSFAANVKEERAEEMLDEILGVPAELAFD